MSTLYTLQRDLQLRKSRYQTGLITQLVQALAISEEELVFDSIAVSARPRRKAGLPSHLDDYIVDMPMYRQPTSLSTTSSTPLISTTEENDGF